MTTESTTLPAYDQMLETSREIRLLGSIDSLLGWDQETMMPKGGAEYRARQLALLARLRHEQFTSQRMGELIAECESEFNTDEDTMEAANIRHLRHDYDRMVKLPGSLVEEIASTASQAQRVWMEAREKNDFEGFRPMLEKTVELCRRKAECFGWAEGGEPWDALAEDYEPGCTAAGVAEVFDPLRARLRTLVSEIREATVKPDSRLDEIPLSRDEQMAFCRFVCEQLGFDFNRGRLDVSTHPFCGGSHCDDVRMTTRFHECMLTDALGSTMHEAGHGIYEQGLKFEYVGTPMGNSVSLGIHESQSRMWENQVGRSVAFWEWCAPKLEQFFGEAVRGISPQIAYETINRVQTGLIRVEADEATYNMHIMIRFELERALLNGDLQVGDLPGEWNRMYKEYLGVDVPDDRRGCLQDIHWSMGALGYFPTYTLGNLYCAQFFEAAQAAMPGLDDDFRNGRFDRLRTWLNEQIHQHGERYSPEELCRRVTGKELSSEPLMRHLEGKYRALYHL